jgi:hypothetical protein
VLNGLPLDSLYPAAGGSTPDRAKEVLQSWEAVRELNRRLVVSDPLKSLRHCAGAVSQASQTYDEIPLTLDTKSNGEHLESIREGMQLFARLAEIELPTD